MEKRGYLEKKKKTTLAKGRANVHRDPNWLPFQGKVIRLSESKIHDEESAKTTTWGENNKRCTSMEGGCFKPRQYRVNVKKDMFITCLAYVFDRGNSI